MFWKNVNFFKPSTWSLVNKLMILYSLSTFSVLLAAFLYLYPSFMQVLHGAISAPFPSSQKIAYSPVVLEEKIKNFCFQRVIVTLLLGASGGIILGYVIARNALKRIDDLSNTMDKIKGASLSERLTLNDWPKELRILGEKFNEMLNRIEHSFEKLSQFSADIAHELRNPIHNLTGLTEIALMKDKNKEEYKEVLISHLEEYRTISKLIENLLFLARKEHDQIKLNKQPIQLKSEIEKIGAFYSPIFEEKNIEFYLQGDACLMVDVVLFNRIISNILLNSLHYTSENGKISVAVTESDRQINIALHDNGVGIPAAHLPKLFDRFYRVDGARSKQSGGLGLGLSIVKSIVELHRGTIQIESQVNQGTSVCLSFPAGRS